MKLFKLSAAVIAITAAWVTQPVFGGGIAPTSHQLVITENSSVFLSATYDGSAAAVSVLNTGSDLWTLTFAPTVTFLANLDVGWIEPENPSQVNLISTTNTPSNQLFVTSDTSPNLTSVFQDGIITNFAIGTDLSSFAPGPVFATFHDNAAASEATVPDTGTTFSLFGLSLMGLAFLRRKLC
jgi:VPDSG-CTERM motif